MAKMSRRNVLSAAAVLPWLGALPARAQTDLPPGGFAPPLPGREVVRRRFFPDVAVTTEEGNRVRFYDDLIRDKIVVLNLMYADCTGVCPTITAHLAAARKILAARGAQPLSIVSITIKPEEDTPEKLKKYAAMHQTGAGWHFVTGKSEDLELLRRKLGYTDLNPSLDQDRSRHSGMIRYGNEPLALWGSCQGQAKPEWIAEEISYVLRRA
jgi:protein SCO1